MFTSTKGFENRIRRAGSLNAFADLAFLAAVADTHRKNLGLAGLLTDVCLFHSTVLGDTVTYARLRSFGIQAVTT